MKTKKDNTPLVDEHLQSVQVMQQAETKPFFYSRLKSRIEMKKDNRSTGFGFSPAYVICTLFIFLMINFWMIRQQKEDKKQPETSVSSLYSFADTYNFKVSGY